NSLMLVDAGFDESQLGSAAGKPATTATKSGGDFERNVEAATQYIDQLMSRQFADAKVSEVDRTMFTFASYKARSDKIASMRKEARRRGLPPTQWFNNAELVTAEKLGLATTAYVRNILKYTVAYKVITEAEVAQKN